MGAKQFLFPTPELHYTPLHKLRGENNSVPCAVSKYRAVSKSGMYTALCFRVLAVSGICVVKISEKHRRPMPNTGLGTTAFQTRAPLDEIPSVSKPLCADS